MKKSSSPKNKQPPLYLSEEEAVPEMRRIIIGCMQVIKEGPGGMFAAGALVSVLCEMLVHMKFDEGLAAKFASDFVKLGYKKRIANGLDTSGFHTDRSSALEGACTAAVPNTDAP